jgi:hypothetical protein
MFSGGRRLMDSNVCERFDDVEEGVRSCIFLYLQIQPAKADGQDTANHMLEASGAIAYRIASIAGDIALAGGRQLGSRGGVQRGLHSFSTKHPRDNTSPTLPLRATACTCLSAGSVGLGSGDS